MTQQRRSRRWPPNPIVEDLYTALAHEHNPPPDAFSSDDDVTSRGSADQFPIILDAEMPRYQPTGPSDLRSKSSDDSLGPQTPQGYSNADMRYVWKPKEGIEIPLTYDEPREPVERKRDRSAQPKAAATRTVDDAQRNAKSRDVSQNRPSVRDTLNVNATRPRAPSTSAVPPRRDGPNLNIETNADKVRARSQEPLQSGNSGRRDGSTMGSGMGTANVSRTKEPVAGLRPTADTRIGQETPSPPSAQSSGSGIPSRMRFDARTGREYPVPPSSEHGARRPPPIDPRLGRDENIPLSTRREPSPYAYTSSSSKSTFSGDSLLSPDSISPEMRQRGLDRFGRPRAASNSGPQSPRPTFDRHASAMGYPGEPLPMPRTQPRYDNSSDSDSSRRYQQTRSSQNPSTRPDPRLMDTQPRLNSAQTFPIRPHDAFVGPPRMGTLNNLPRQQNPPQYSPPASPGPDSRRDRTSKGYDTRGSGSRPNSRPTTPLAWTPQGSPSNMTPHWGGRSETGSRQTSPIPSPQPSPRFETAPVLPARMPGIPPRPGSRDGAPGLPSRPETQQARPRPPALPLRTESNLLNGFYIPPIFNSPQTATSQGPYCVPSENPSHTPQTPGLRPDLPRSRQPSPIPGVLTPLPSCPRSTFSAEPDDWYTLVGNDLFHLCSTCRTAVEDTGYDRHFTPMAPLPPGTRIRCDFSKPWIRMAWLLTQKENLPHVNLLHSFAYIISREQPCPGNTGSAKHDWYKLYDPETRREITNFDVCSFCVRSVENLFPNLKGIFIPAPRDERKRICDLTTDSPRFAAYADTLESISNEARVYRRPANMARFITLARQNASVRPCPENIITYNRPWHFIPNLPEFTICEECFEKHVVPIIKDGSELANRFGKLPQLLPPDFEEDGGSCRIWTKSRVEKLWKMCANEDYAALKAWARTS